MFRKITYRTITLMFLGLSMFFMLKIVIHHGAMYLCNNHAKTLDVNLATMDIVDKYGLSSQKGWWMKDEGMWTVARDCGIGGIDNCKNILTTECKPYRIKSTYLFIPIKRESPLTGFHFSLWSNRENMTEPRGKAIRFFGAMFFVRYSDSTNDSVEMQLPLGGTGYTRTYLDFIIPQKKAPITSVTSVTIVLTCKGYKGIVKFSDVNVKPIIPLYKSIEVDEREFRAADFIESCPKVPSPFPVVPEFKTDHILITNGKFDTTAPTPVTLVAQLSIDRLDTVVHTLNIWEGPVSLALYIPADETGGHAVQEQRQKTACGTILNLDLGKGLYCDVTFVYGNYPNEYYQINVMRNAAMNHVKTEYLFIADADFVPSPSFQEVFELVMENNFFHDKSTRQESLLNRAAFIVPAFECKTSCAIETLPSNKEELVNIVKSNKPRIQAFRWENAAGAHSSTDYEHWYITDSLYGIDRYQDKYEPYVVIRKHDNMPLFDERFGSYGMNKVSYIMELKAAGYEFLVLPNCWLTHLPHENTKDKNLFINSRIEELKNRLLRFEFIIDLSRKYRFGDCMVLN
ncbi:unnamed protein product [Owenia fusiformis]|uniref:Uncharacterized protein n=1 Tax=Owenia fusiformis TaxID=6347 RepID=A0A8J1TB05_OWEFU|nr:unnamed protein product [Owenia fusiformis]